MSLHYADYLHLGALLGCQQPKSNEGEHPAHDETLFIITHQAYELWFKQIIFELTGNPTGVKVREEEPRRGVLPVLTQKFVRNNSLIHAVSSLERIHKILELLLHQIDVLETMQPLDFLDFRDVLQPASGFQSGQYRMIENLLGLRDERRVKVEGINIEAVLSEEDRLHLAAIRKLPSVHDQLDAWLSRTPFLEFRDYDFWAEYKEAVEEMHRNERKLIQANPFLSDKEREMGKVDAVFERFEGLFDEELYERERSEGLRRLSYQSFKAALFISIYRQEPMLQVPYRLLSTLVDIDEALTRWRHRHALMVQRMIGIKVGTGGSKGIEYLLDTTKQHRIYGDLLGLSTYLIPRQLTPKLPEGVLAKLQLHFEPNG